MAWVRILVGCVWLSGAIEKLLNPQFPQQLAASFDAGGFIAASPPWFANLMGRFVVPNAEAFAQFVRFGELALGLALILGLLTNPAALGSLLFSLALLFSTGGPSLGTGLGAPELLSVNLLLALLSLLVLVSPAAKAFSIDASLAQGRPRLNTLLLNNRNTRRQRRA
jgi:thiosulfate dehydrogenase [quinone] large subunit